MKVAIVNPRPYGGTAMETMGYHLVLAQKLLSDHLYRDWYRMYRGQLGLVIVDNGAAEMDTPPFQEVVDVANHIWADEVVLPDVINNYHATLEALARVPGRVWDKLPIHKRFAVPQGETFEEWSRCLGQIVGQYHVHTLGLSKYRKGSRLALLEHLRKLNMFSEWSVHMLGIQTAKPLDELRAICLNFPEVRGIDTGAPIAWAQNGQAFQDLMLETPQRFSLDWEAPFDRNLATTNINAMLVTAQGAKP